MGQKHADDHGRDEHDDDDNDDDDDDDDDDEAATVPTLTLTPA